ncbi:MAG: ADP-glyceromanno-heptose 6-epimerase [Alphaproteobacteria bacterium]
MLVITGGGGFIGSVLAASLNETGRSDLVLVDRFGGGDKWRNIAKRDFDEIMPPETLFDWLDRCGDAVETVFHLGAISETTFLDADEIIRSNLNYSIALWRWCAARRKKFIYASSAATYGDGSSGFSDGGGIEALKRLRPLNLYGWSKHAFDLWAMRQAAAGTAPPLWAGFKFFNVFGPNEYHKGDMMSLVVKNHSRILAGETIPLFRSYRPDYADGEQLRDFVYVKDCVAAMLWLWRHEPEGEPDAPVSGIYNLGSGEARSFLDLMRALGAACGVEPKIEFIDMPAAIRPNYQYFTQADMTRLRRAGHNVPSTPLEDAVRDCVTQYLAQPDPYL